MEESVGTSESYIHKSFELNVLNVTIILLIVVFYLALPKAISCFGSDKTDGKLFTFLSLKTFVQL